MGFESHTSLRVGFRGELHTMVSLMHMYVVQYTRSFGAILFCFSCRDTHVNRIFLFY